MVEQQPQSRVARAMDLLSDPVLLVGPEASPAARTEKLAVLYSNARAEGLVDDFPGSVVEAAARQVLARRAAATVRWDPVGSGPGAGYVVRLVPVDEGTVAVQCSVNDELAPLLVDAYRVADEARMTLSGALDAAPDAFVVLEDTEEPPVRDPMVRYHNARAAVLLGMSEDADGHRLDDVCSPAWARRLLEAARAAGPVGRPLRVHDLDGSGARTGAYDVTAVRADRGTRTIVVVMVRDAMGDERIHPRVPHRGGRAAPNG